MRILDAKNPRWANEEKTKINLDVNFEGIAEQYVEFTASALDSTSYGKELFNLAKIGKLGAIE
jgi:hypothetical protein